MKKIAIYSISLLFIAGSLLTGCQAIKNSNNTQRGAGIGVAAGALLGGIMAII